MNRTLKFAIDKITLIELSDSQNALVEVKVCHTGMNAHQLPIPLEALQNASETIINKWLVAGWDGEDFKGHEKDQRIIGFFPKENNFRYIEENGKTYFVANAIISKLYADWAFEIFKEENFRECSMEIMILETQEKDGFEWIMSYIYNAVTILGKYYKAACPGSSLSVTKFSEEDLVNIRETVTQSFSIKEVNTSLNNITTKKEVEQVIFDKDEFAKTFSITANELWDMLSNACREVKYQEEGDDYRYTRYYMRDHDGEYIYAYDYKEDKSCAIPYSINEGKATLDFDNIKSAKQTWVITEKDEDSFSMITFAKEILSKDFAQFNTDITSFQEKVTVLENEKQEILEKFSTLESEKNELVTKFSEKESEMENLKTENASLLEFKVNVEETEKSQKIEFAINTVSEDLSQEQIDEWRGKVKEFNSIEEFGNAIKAFAYENSKGKNPKDGEIVKMSLPSNPIEEKKSNSVWERLN